MRKPINVTSDGLAYALKASYSKNASTTSPARQSLSVRILGHWSPTSQMGGRVISAEGLAPTVMAGTHGYGFGMVMVYESDSD